MRLGRVRAVLVGLVLTITIAGGVVGVVAAVGCQVKVKPPVGVADPVTVYLTDQGRHASLVLPREGTGGESGGLVEYAYGEWEWFALGRDEWWRAPGVLFLPNQGALGRREWPRVESAADLCGMMSAEGVSAVRVDRGRARALLERLDARYEAARDTEVYNGVYELWFVKDPDTYSVMHHCNTVVSGWMEELGAGVEGWTWSGEFVVR